MKQCVDRSGTFMAQFTVADGRVKGSFRYIKKPPFYAFPGPWEFDVKLLKYNTFSLGHGTNKHYCFSLKDAVDAK